MDTPTNPVVKEGFPNLSKLIFHITFPVSSHTLFKAGGSLQMLQVSWKAIPPWVVSLQRSHGSTPTEPNGNDLR